MSVMVENPHAYFSQWIAERSDLLAKMESEAADEGIPIVGPVVGRLLFILVMLSGPRRIMELGTATGYSAIFMGEACRQARQGRIITFEIDPGMAARARNNIARAGLQDVIEVRCRNALEVLSGIGQPVDMLFMDIEKQDYVKLLPLIETVLRPNGLLVADNTGFKDAHSFNRSIHESPVWTSVNLWALLPGHSPVHDGICIAMKTA